MSIPLKSQKEPMTSLKPNSALDIDTIRSDFPIMQRKVNNQPLIYLDNAATTQKPQSVIDALVDYYTFSNSNIHRGLHTLAEEATNAYVAARTQIASFINATSNREIIFTRNTTESLNLLAHTLGMKLQPGDEILLSGMEHHSNIVPWQLAAKRHGAILTYLEVDENGEIDVDQARELMGPRTKIVSVVHMSNVLGTINPIDEIARMAHEAGAYMIVDAAQSVPHMPVDVQKIGADFLTFSAHKMLGPTGVGILWGDAALLRELDPFMGGGEMINVVTLQESSWANIPHKFEAGTPNIADVIAFGNAINYLTDIGMESVRAHDLEITSYALDRLKTLEGIQIYGPNSPERRGGVTSFNYLDIHPHDLSTVLDKHGIAIRAGHHCAQPLMRTLKVPATARASYYIYNRLEEIDTLVSGLQDAARLFGFPNGTSSETHKAI